VKKLLTLSLIIPVYNEEHHIRGCLEAIANQTVKPDEVIVVDNNCTDKTIEIAEEFSFVRILNERKQGLIAARNTGLHAAKGEILGRIDADAVLDRNWVKNVIEIFTDLSVQGATGVAITNTLPPPFKHPYTTLWSRFYFMWREALTGTKVLWGANMAMRRSAWESIKDEVCLDDSMVHEDQDISYLFAKRGFKIVWKGNLRIRTEGHHYYAWPKLKEYLQRAQKTYEYHKEKGSIPADRSVQLNLYQRSWRFLVVGIPALFALAASFLQWKIGVLFTKRKTSH